MKYLGTVSDPKDIATKEYVDNQVNKPPYKQTFVVSSSAHNIFDYYVPYDSEHTAEELLNFNCYAYDLEGLYNPKVCTLNYWYVFKSTYNGEPVWDYSGYLYASPNSGSTIVFENSFTDSDGVYVGRSSM